MIPYEPFCILYFHIYEEQYYGIKILFFTVENVLQVK